VRLDVQHVRQLWFLRHARQFGFSIDECRELLSLWANSNSRAEVHSLVSDKVRDIEQHIRELREMKKVLTELLVKCPVDDSSECVIIDELAQNKD